MAINTVQVAQPSQNNIIDTSLQEETEKMTKAIKKKFFGSDESSDDEGDESSDDKSDEGDKGDKGSDIADVSNASNVSNAADAAKADSATTTIPSDERLKDIFGADDIVANFAKIKAYEFKYKPEALKLYDEENGVDNGTNVGVMAQELEKNPVTENVVNENENGHKVLDTKKLTAANSAVLSDVCKRLINIERILGIGDL